MTFHLDLAIAYACALVLFYWLASWMLPALARALAAWLRGCCRDPDRRQGGGGRPQPLLSGQLLELGVRPHR